MPPNRETLQRALNLAARAPSPHNTQPWRVTQSGESIVIHADAARLLHHTDPLRRDAGIALGAFAEALLIALAVEGHASDVSAQEPGERIELRVGQGAPIENAKELASLLRQRQTSRLGYSPREIDKTELDGLSEAIRPFGLETYLVPRGTKWHAPISEWLFAASRESWLDERASVELGEWLRLDFEGLRAPTDGLSTEALGLSIPEALALKGLMRPGPWRLLGSVMAAPMLAETLAKAEVAQASQCPLFAIWVSREPARASGAGVLRAWLELTRRRFAMHPISVLLDRRGWEVSRLLGVDARHLAMAFRLGRSAPPVWSGRRPVEQFAELSG